MDRLRYIAGGFLAVVLLVTSTPAVDAYTTYNSNAAQIAELQATIMRLQAQLDALRGYGNNDGWNNSDSGVVTTGSAVHRGNGDVDFRGSVRPGSTQSKVWFEFGPNRSLSYSTPKLSIPNSGNSTRNFTGYAYDLGRGTYYYRAVLEDRRGDTHEGSVMSINVGGSSYNNYDDDWYDNTNDWNDDDEDAPDVTTDDAEDVTTSRAELQGEVDMQDAEDGLVFFVYGEDEDQVDEAADEDRYSDIDTDNEDLQKVKVASHFDDEDDFYAVVTGLDNNTDHYFRICVEYEDTNNDERLACGDVESFETE